MAKDIAVDDQGIKINNGDLLLDESLNQDLFLILMTGPGQWRQFPVTGVNYRSYLSGPVTPETQSKLLAEVQNQLDREGLAITASLERLDSLDLKFQ